MDIVLIAQFAFATLLPALACAILLFVRRAPSVAKIPERSWRVIVGVVFGLIAIYGTEAGIPMDGATMNVRDAAPLAAALIFSGPSGIIAGLIGGIERWFAVLWGAGEFTRIACSIGTIFAGFYAALLRKFLFERHIPNLAFAFATGVVAEVMHLMLIILTHPDELALAFDVTQKCAPPMITCVGLATLLCSFVTSLIKHEPLLTPNEKRNVVRILHTRMLIAVVVAFFLTVGFTAILQTKLSQSETHELLRLNIEDVENNIVDASDSNLLAITNHAVEAIPSVSSATNEKCVDLAAQLDVAEIDVINSDGIIVASNKPEYINFDMHSGEQSAAFLVLLPGGRETQLVQSYQPIAYDANTSMKYAGMAINGGFLQVGYDAENFTDDLSVQVEASVRNRHVGQTGAFVVIDEKGNVISTRDDVVDQTAEKLIADSSKAEAGQLYTTTFAGEECFADYQVVEGYHIIALLPLSEAYESRDVSVLIIAFMEVLVFAALFLVIYAVMKVVFVRGIRKMNQQLGQITDGNLGVIVDVRTASELSSLSDDINQTVGALRGSLAVVKADLDMAASIQANTLPDITSTLADRPEFELLATMEPAKEVGGDFYDFFLIDDDHLALVVADVSGKGVPAALFMMQSKIVIKMEALSGLTPSEVLLRANADLSEKNDEDMFTTVWLGVLEISTGKLTYADAGHEKLALYHDGAWEMPKKPNGAVALASFPIDEFEELPERFRYRNHTVMLKPGDGVFQYTDGVTEATSIDEDLFGEERLLGTLNEAKSAAPEIVLPLMRKHVTEFVNGAPQHDDITMLGLLYKGTSDYNKDQPKNGMEANGAADEG